MQSYFNWKVTGVAITCSDKRHHIPVHILDEGNVLSWDFKHKIDDLKIVSNRYTAKKQLYTHEESMVIEPSNLDQNHESLGHKTNEGAQEYKSHVI
jgi:hypothetical protein